MDHSKCDSRSEDDIYVQRYSRGTESWIVEMRNISRYMRDGLLEYVGTCLFCCLGSFGMKPQAMRTIYWSPVAQVEVVINLLQYSKHHLSRVVPLLLWRSMRVSATRIMSEVPLNKKQRTQFTKRKVAYFQGNSLMRRSASRTHYTAIFAESIT